MKSVPRIDVVGLGPAGDDLVTVGTRALIDEVPNRFSRTERHPAAHLVAGASFDHHYDTFDTFAEVYQAIVHDLHRAAVEHGRVLYAVPGSPRVAEHTVNLLCQLDGVEVVVHPALSFVDLSWVALGLDPLDKGVRIVDGHRFAVEAAGERGPLLVAQCHSQEVLSDIKLSVDDVDLPPVVVLQRLGAADQSVTTVAWEDLDRSVVADHLTSIYIPQLGRPIAPAFAQFDVLVRRLRADCPWDAEQTHASLRRYLLEESYETLEALDQLSAALDADTEDLADVYGDLEEELGDLLYQIFFHALLATEQGWFTAADVATGIHDKLYERHPHVFGDAEMTLDQLPAQWEQSKLAEKNRASVMDGIPAALPALLYATKVQKKAIAIGHDVTSGDAAAALRTALDDLLHGDPDHPESVMGALMFGAVELARELGIDAETALRQHAVRVADEVRSHEAGNDY